MTKPVQITGTSLQFREKLLQCSSRKEFFQLLCDRTGQSADSILLHIGGRHNLNEGRTITQEFLSGDRKFTKAEAYAFADTFNIPMSILVEKDYVAVE